MAIRDKMQENAKSLLEPGETIQAVFGAQPANPYWVLVSYWIVITKGYRVIVVTDRRILVCKSGNFTTATVKGVLATLPRSTRIGPATGIWYKTEALGERLYVHKRYHKDIEAADAAIPSAA